MYFYFRLFLFVLFATSQLACAFPQLNFKNKASSAIEGQVVVLRGNGMPNKGKTSFKGHPLLTKVYIYKPLRLAQLEHQIRDNCSKINGVLVETAFTDSNGYYHINLKPGQYSIVVAHQNGYFIPFFSGMDGVAYINIDPQKTSILNIRVNDNASY